MNDQISNLLEQLESEMEKAKAPVLQLLNPGLEESKILTQLKTIGVTLPPEAIDLYKWHNGTGFKDNLYNAEQTLFFGALFPIINVAIETYVFYTKSDKNFKKQYFSLFETQGGVMFLIDCDKTSTNYGMILKHDISRVVSPKVVTTVYDSMACFIETITQCYKQGIYTIDDNEGQRVLSSDYIAEIMFSQKMNPKSKYWKILKNSVENER